MTLPFEPKTIVAAVTLAALWLAEHRFPFFVESWPNRRERFRHDAKNLGIGIMNSILSIALLGTLLAVVEVSSEQWGLLRLLAMPAIATTIAALLILDLWMYVWHRLNHAIPLLWRFHRMHHSDPAMDASTGVRFHTGEIMMSGLARAALLPIIGLSLWQMALYESILLPVVLFHHSNVRLPRWLDYGLTVCVVTPAMHRVHHSRWRPEANSNFASVLPIWDRLFRSFRLRDDARTIHLGLAEFDDHHWQTLAGMLRTPLAQVNQDAGPREQDPRNSPVYTQ